MAGVQLGRELHPTGAEELQRWYYMTGEGSPIQVPNSLAGRIGSCELNQCKLLFITAVAGLLRDIHISPRRSIAANYMYLVGGAESSGVPRNWTMPTKPRLTLPRATRHSCSTASPSSPPNNQPTNHPTLHIHSRIITQLSAPASRKPPAMDVEESPWADTKQPPPTLDEEASTTTAKSTPATTPSTSQAAAPSPSPRPSRGPRRLVAQPTRLEAVEDPLGPLGADPSGGDGGSPDDDGAPPPVPPQKEQVVIRTTMSPSQGQQQQQQQSRRPPADPHHIEDDDGAEGQRGPRPPPPVEAARPSGVRSNTQPSVSVEQAAKPTFHISVGDPVKIGDLTSSHIVYSVRTRVGVILL